MSFQKHILSVKRHTCKMSKSKCSPDTEWKSIPVCQISLFHMVCLVICFNAGNLDKLKKVKMANDAGPAEIFQNHSHTFPMYI